MRRKIKEKNSKRGIETKRKQMNKEVLIYAIFIKN